MYSVFFPHVDALPWTMIPNFDDAVAVARKVGFTAQITDATRIVATWSPLGGLDVIESPKTFEFAGNRYLLTADGLGAHRWIKARGAWEKKVAVFAELNAEFQAAGKTAK